MQDIMDSLSTYGYLILFLYSFGGGFVALLAAGVLSSIGKMDITLSIVIASISNMLGDIVLFYMGRYNRVQIRNYLKKHRRKLALAHIMMKKYGEKIIFIQKFIYGVKTAVPVAIGFTKFDMRRFIILNIVASIFWALTVGLIAYLSGEYIISIFNYFGEYPYIAPIFAIALLYLAWVFIAKKSQKKQKG